MKLDLNIKIDGNTKMIVIWTILLLMIAFGIAFLADHKEGFIVVQQLQNCTIERSWSNSGFTDFGTMGKETINFNYSKPKTMIDILEGCIEVPCVDNCKGNICNAVMCLECLNSQNQTKR